MSDEITESRRGTYFSSNKKMPLWKTTNNNYTPNSKKNMILSYIKTGFRIIGYSFIPFNLVISMILLIISEMLSIIQNIFYTR